MTGDDIIETGSYAGESRSLRRWAKMFPLGNAALSTFNKLETAEEFRN